MLSRKLLSTLLIEGGGAPKDITGAGLDGDWVHVKDARALLILLLTGAWAGGTSAVTLEQATDNAGAGAKALAFTERFEKTGYGATSPWVRSAVTANTFDLAAANKVVAIEIDAAELDVNADFCYVRARAATPGANADLLAMAYLFGDSRYQSAPETLPEPKV